ncbi:MAG: helix-turn-helix transcriptional regulator [Clostridia bacterium]|nr:helix-turn-helix transcriptional regulator [Clostridia bacterium]
MNNITENNTVMIEPPKTVGQEIELFLQHHPAHNVACEPHIHTAVEMLYVKEGDYTVHLDYVPYPITVGDLILFRSDAVHTVTAGDCERNSYYVIKIPPSFFLNLAGGEAGVRYSMPFAFNRKDSKCLWTKAELEGSAILTVLSELIAEYGSEKYAAELVIRLKIMELMTSILRECHGEETHVDSRSASLIYNVMSYVQKNYADDVDEKELSRSYGMSYSYFSRTFKKITGVTFKNYLNRIRISNAERLLFSTGSSVSEIATACGYNSISYFISVYRSMMGITPYKALRTATDGENSTNQDFDSWK